MKMFLILGLTLPLIANCSGITENSGIYNSKEDSNINSKIVIDLNKSGQFIDKNFYGSHFDSYSEKPSKDLVDELQLGKIRIGGNEFDMYNWKINKAATSSGEIRDVFSFESIANVLKNYNVEGIFQINLTGFQPVSGGASYVIKRTFTANSAYEVVKYLNGQMKLNITNFSLGNEFSIWNETHSKVWPNQDGISADDYIDRYINFAIAIRKAQEENNGNPNSIKIWGPEISTSWYDWNTGNFTTDCQWSDTQGQVSCNYGNGKFTKFMPYFLYRLKNAEKDLNLNPRGYKLIDYLSIHYYPNFRTNISDVTSIVKNPDGRQLVAEMLESTRVLNDPTFSNKIDISSYKNFIPNILGRTNGWIKQYYPDVKLAINEFAVDSDYRSNFYHPIIRPLYLADAIGIFTKENVSFFNQFQLSTEKDSNMPWSMIEGGVRKDLFYMYKLFSNNLKGTILSVEDNMGDVVNGYASIEDNFINLAIVNKDPVEKNVQIYIKNGTTKKLTTYLIPPWSTSILKMKNNNSHFDKKFTILQFGAKEMGVPAEIAYRKKN